MNELAALYRHGFTNAEPTNKHKIWRVLHHAEKVSTMRIEALRRLPLRRDGDRLAVASGESGTGWSGLGIAETFATTGPRSLYHAAGPR